MKRRHVPLKSARLHKREKQFIQKACALRYSRQSTLKAVRKFRAKKGLSVSKQQVNQVYSHALKQKHVRKARRTTMSNMERKRYTAKGRRQRMNLMVNLIEKLRSMSRMVDVPDSESP